MKQGFYCFVIIVLCQFYWFSGNCSASEKYAFETQIAEIKSAHSRVQRSGFKQHQIFVKNADELYQAVSKANVNSNTSIILKKGAYTLSATLNFTGDYISIRSEDDTPSSVIIRGPGMIKASRVFNLIRVSGKHFTLSGLTVDGAPNHIIQIAGESDADFITIKNCRLQNAREQILKVSANVKRNVSSDLGLIENCIFAYTNGIGPQFYIGGIDMHGATQWIIRNNQFFGIASPENRVAEHAIHLWNSSDSNLVANNLIVNSDRGIGFGLKGFKNNAGVILHNTIIHADLGHPKSDVGIVLEESPNTIIKNNTVVLLHGYSNAIEYRFTSTSGVKISGNRVNKRIHSRNGGKATLSGNMSIDKADEVVNQAIKKLPPDLRKVFEEQR